MHQAIGWGGGRGEEGRHSRADGVTSVSDRGLVVGDGTVGG